jgi:hypothetical protein
VRPCPGAPDRLMPNCPAHQWPPGFGLPPARWA